MSATIIEELLELSRDTKKVNRLDKYLETKPQLSQGEVLSILSVFTKDVHRLSAIEEMKPFMMSISDVDVLNWLKSVTSEYIRLDILKLVPRMLTISGIPPDWLSLFKTESLGKVNENLGIISGRSVVGAQFTVQRQSECPPGSSCSAIRITYT
jgi:hypothetical protein